MPSSDLDDRYLKLFRPHLAADKLNRNIRSHRHAESRFRHARDERIGDWQNRQRVLFADVQKFLDGTALTDTLLEYDNARDKEIDTLRATIDDETVRDALIDKAMQDNPYRLWQAIENTLGAKKVTDIKVLKNQIDFGIVDHTNYHGVGDRNRCFGRTTLRRRQGTLVRHRQSHWRFGLAHKTPDISA